MSNSNAGPVRGKSLSLPEPLKYTISIMVLLASVAVAVLLYQLRESNSKKETDALIPLVDTSTVVDFDGDLDLVVSGTVVPFREIKIGAEVSGRILRKFTDCEAGNYVTKGTRMLEIDPADYLLEIKTMNSEILQATRTLEETEQEIRGAMKSLEIAQTDHKLQKNEFRRFEKLQSSLSATEFDQAKRNMLNTESQLTTRQNTYDMLLARKSRLESSVALIKNQLEKAELNLNRTVVTAPVDGVIVRESVEQGDYVTVASELFVFEDTSRAEVLCSLTPGELAWLRQHAPPSAFSHEMKHVSSVYQLPRVDVEIYEQAEPEITWMGILERFDGIGRNEMTKSIPCRIVVNNPVIETESGERALVRGMYVKCRVVLPTYDSDLDLAAFESDGIRPGDYVWVVRDNLLRSFDVNVIDRTPCARNTLEKLVVVALDGSGLRKGDQIVTGPLPQPSDGGQVVLRDAQAVMADGQTVSPGNRREASTKSADDVVPRTRTSGQARRTSHRDRSEP